MTAEQLYHQKKYGNSTIEANATIKERKNTSRNVRFYHKFSPIPPSHSERVISGSLILERKRPYSLHSPGNANVTPTRSETSSSSITTQQLHMPVITEESRWEEAVRNARRGTSTSFDFQTTK